MAGTRLGARRLFGDQQAAFGDLALERLILGRIEDVDAARHDRHCAAFQRALMRGGIDAACQAGDDDNVRTAQFGGKLPGKADCRRRGVAGADNRHRPTFEKTEIAFHN